MSCRGPAHLRRRHYACGTRGSYNSGCRCEACRRAHRDYARARYARLKQQSANPWVDVTEARRHLLDLQRRGIGLVSVAEATDLSARSLFDIRSGRQRRARAHTVAKILAMRDWAGKDHTRVRLERVRAVLATLREEGYTLTDIDRRLNPARPRPRPLPLGHHGITRWRFERLCQVAQRMLG